MRATTRRTYLKVWSIALALLVGACANQNPPIAAISILEARATSRTSVVVVFSAPVDAATVTPQAFTIVGPDASPLDVVSATAFDDGSKVALGTAPQQLVEYSLVVQGVGGIGVAAPGDAGITGAFGGSGTAGPVVSHAVPLTNTTLLVTFIDAVSGEPVAMGDAAEQRTNYSFGAAGIEVLGAAFAPGYGDRSRVVLTTSPMDDTPYTVKVSNVLSQAGEMLVDPFSSTGLFQGIGASDTRPPTMTVIQPRSAEEIVIRFSEPVVGGAGDPTRYVIEDGGGSVLPVTAASLKAFGTEATIATWPMTQGQAYQLLEIAGTTDKTGNGLILGSNAGFTYTGAPRLGDEVAPRVLGATSFSNTEVIVTFSEPVLGAEDPRKYQIVDRASLGNLTRQSVLLVESVTVSANRRSATLTTRAQSEILYALTVTGVADEDGNEMTPPDRDNPFHVTFVGTPSSGTFEDRDGDGLSDAAEQAGWTVTVRLANGQTASTKVTSDPDTDDTDQDGLLDSVERSYLMNPRSSDTDADDLSDFWELNHIYSDPSGQDTDGDGLIDGLEWWTFRTSPNLADTDGDQIDDDVEVQLGNRNPRLADLPLPGIEIGQVDLQLDVRFTATSSTSSRELESRTVSSTLNQSEGQKTSNTDSNTQQFAFKAGAETGWEIGATTFGSKGKFSVEASYSGQWTSSFTRESTQSTQRTYSDSLQTQADLQIGESATRQVAGAAMRLSLNLRSLGDIAFNISNVQVTAFVQDPLDPGSLRPVATLVPESAPAGGFNLGPMTPERGPLIFVSVQIFPSLVEDLMRDPTGLVFKLANFDIRDEVGRNFAFTSQDVNDRTATIVIDYGAMDSDGDGESDITERLKVSTSGGMNPDDPSSEDGRVLFDLDGNHVGITLVDALKSVLGLEHFDEIEDPTDSLTLEQIQNSYSTVTVDGRQVLMRVREVSRDLTDQFRRWVLLTETGLVADEQDLSSVVLHAGEGVTLAFIQDLDGDGVPARIEYLLGCSDQDADTDSDDVPPVLSDREETFGGWQINVRGRGGYTGYSSCAREDTDLDGLTDIEEKELTGTVTVLGVPTVVPLPTDARNPDTDRDGISDYDEANGVTINVLFGSPVTVRTNPLDPDSDGDTLPDGAERQLRTNPTVHDGDKVLDNDRDGLVNFLEDMIAWDVSYRTVSTAALPQGQSQSVAGVLSDRDDPDTDDDGLNDREEYDLGTNPTDPDTDGDGLSDLEEVEAGTDPRDADSDDDWRSDGDEVNVGLIIDIAGEDDYEVFSDPLEADADNDGWSDGEEASEGTDPTKLDTDGDGGGKNDKEEGETCVGSGATEVCRDPLAADQRLTVRFTLDVNLDGDLDPLGGEGDFSHVLTIERGSSSNLSESGQVFLNNNSSTFVWTPSFIRTLSEALTIDIVVYESDGVAEDGETCRLDNRKDIGGIPGVVGPSQNYTTPTVNDFVNDPIAECEYSMSIGFQAD